MKVIQRLIVFLISVSSIIGHTQPFNPNLDSLFRVWNDQSEHDTNRLNAMHIIAMEGYIMACPDSAMYYAQLEYDFAKNRGLKKQIAKALLTQGNIFSMKGDYSKALDCYQQSLEIEEELNNVKGIAYTLIDIGGVYDSRGEYSIAMEYYQRSLRICEEILDKKGIADGLYRTGIIYEAQGYGSKALDHYLRVLTIYKEISDNRGIAKMLHTIGYVYTTQANYSKALEYVHEAIRICEENDDKYLMTFCLNLIGGIYIETEEYSKALEYYQRSLKISEEMSDENGIIRSMIDIGVIYHHQNDFNSALECYQRGLKVCEEISDKQEMARILRTIGAMYFFFEEDTIKTLEYIKRSLMISEEISDKRGIIDYSLDIGTLHRMLGNYKESIGYCEEALTIAKELGLLPYQERACENLYYTYKDLDNDNKALEYHEKMLVLTDSLEQEEITKELQQMEFAKKVLADSLQQVAHELEVQITHEKEVRKKERTRNIAYATGILILIVAISLYSRLRYTRRAKTRIEKEKDRSDNLLLNILPAEIAAELKEKGEADARDFENVSVLFTDFVEFTQMSEKLSATELVAEINYCFKGFDAICEKFGIEKIKTIGDAYMAAGGLPVSKNESVRNTVLAAIEMAEFISNRKKEREASGMLAFEMRIGIHTGPVVAGIVGVKKFQYDIWGDTVNTASRMENAGEIGKVNISQCTYDFIKDEPVFAFESRGEIVTKGKGKVQMWFVEKLI